MRNFWQLNAVVYSVTGHRRTWATCLACSVSWFSSVIVNLTQWHQKVGHRNSRMRIVLPKFYRKMDENGAHQGHCSPSQMALMALVGLRWKWFCPLPFPKWSLRRIPERRQCKTPAGRILCRMGKAAIRLGCNMVYKFTTLAESSLYEDYSGKQK